jgi:hypothetical protein
MSIICWISCSILFFWAHAELQWKDINGSRPQIMPMFSVCRVHVASRGLIASPSILQAGTVYLSSGRNCSLWYRVRATGPQPGIAPPPAAVRCLFALPATLTCLDSTAQLTHITTEIWMFSITRHVRISKRSISWSWSRERNPYSQATYDSRTFVAHTLFTTM